jgi:hypothetical protein
MNRDQTIALWLECEAAGRAALIQGKSPGAAHDAARRVWNSWAERLLKERMESGGDSWGSDRFLEGSLLKRSDEEREWRLAAAADFSSFSFAATETIPIASNARTLPYRALLGRQGHFRTFETDFTGFIFPGRVAFENAQFERSTSFGVARFHDGATFEKAAFHKGAFFGGAEFQGWAWFGETQFFAEAQFWGAQFRGEAGFSKTEIGRSGDNRAVLDFTRASFDLDVNLADMRAYGDVSFHQARFDSHTTLEGSIFKRAVDFGALRSTGVFDLSGVLFEQVPQFAQTNFASPPTFDSASIKQPRWWSGHDQRDVAKYRAIRALAIQSHDYQNELTAFKGEVRSRRGTTENYRHGAFWFGLAYDGLADFGLSISRPLLFWLLSLPVFGAAYLVNAGKLTTGLAQCLDGSVVWLKALIFSLKNAVLFVNWDREQIQAAYVCLYGQQTVPTTNALIQMGQSIWSGILIFLFLLAVRNQFKMK